MLLKKTDWIQKDKQTGGGLRLSELLTGNGTQVQVVSDHLLELMVQGALLKLQAEVVMQVNVQHLTWRGGEGSSRQTNKFAT